MAYWLMKSEPDAYSWDQMQADGRTGWSGVRNYQAANNMKAMALGDQAFFYHSNEGREVVGIVRVTKTYHPDPTDETGRFGMVEVAPVRAMPRAVTLAAIKDNKALGDLALVRQSRLSVCPVGDKEWKEICKMGGLT